MVFILSYDAHGPWNIIECYGSDDKWENEVSEEVLPVTRSVQKDFWGLLLLDGRYSRRDQRPSSTVD